MRVGAFGFTTSCTDSHKTPDGELESWIEAAKKRLHPNVLAIALANKLARIAWAVLAKGRAFELTRTDDAGVRPA